MCTRTYTNIVLACMPKQMRVDCRNCCLTCAWHVTYCIQGDSAGACMTGNAYNSCDTFSAMASRTFEQNSAINELYQTLIQISFARARISTTTCWIQVVRYPEKQVRTHEIHTHTRRDAQLSKHNTQHITHKTQHTTRNAQRTTNHTHTRHKCHQRTCLAEAGRQSCCGGASGIANGPWATPSSWSSCQRHVGASAAKSWQPTMQTTTRISSYTISVIKVMVWASSTALCSCPSFFPRLVALASCWVCHALRTDSLPK